LLFIHIVCKINHFILNYQSLLAPALALLNNLLPLGHPRTSSYAARLLAAFLPSLNNSSVFSTLQGGVWL
jgi:hypothetical protein